MVTEGIVIASVDVERSLPPSPAAAAQEAARPGGLRARVRVTTRAMWTNRGQLLEDLHKVGTRVLCSGKAGCDLSCACGGPGACVLKRGRPLVLFEPTGGNYRRTSTPGCQSQMLRDAASGLLLADLHAECTCTTGSYADKP